jgi:hypothetical protein
MDLGEILGRLLTLRQAKILFQWLSDKRHRTVVIIRVLSTAIKIRYDLTPIKMDTTKKR